MTGRILSQVLAADMDVCKEFTVWHFASKYTDVNFENSWLSSHFSSASRETRLATKVLLDTPTGKWPRDRLIRIKWRDYISDLVSYVLVLCGRKNHLILLLTLRFLWSS